MKELMLIQSELKAPKGQFNKFGNYKYRNCEDILEALKPILKLHKCSMIITDDVVVIGERYYIKATVTLTNENNESVSANGYAREAANKKGMDESQITGSTSSYARKYALNGLFAIDDTKDADSMDNRQNNVHQQNNHPQNKQTQQTEFSKFTKTVVQLTGGNAENVTELYQEISQMFQVKIAKTDDFKQQAPEFQKQINQYISQKLGA
ncbi:hypothetical protein D3P96_02830 [Weissella viridescens]|uniref:Essential recombination function protein n=1 Tax=Weissella viridescens TaxID=1629 RepID=A0A3P2RHM1_WEIVI|nr:ERF family protein [Weissella viridescens]RRG18240.1 hypothetical protein D3P96_02830 [Weissella viridescens]